MLVFLFAFLVSSTAYADTPSHFLPDERNTINIYKKAYQNVVFVHRYQRVLSRDLQVFDIPSGSGSGFLFNKDGYVITNYHVVKGSKRLAIRVNNLVSKAFLVGAEPRKDIAVLKIYSKEVLKKIQKFPSLEISDSKNLLVGQKTIAIGNPFGLDRSLSTGVVSALGRKVPGMIGTLRNMIQTDAAINPGNSGGPLLDSSGKVIGMNTAIYSKNGSSSGIGFAVPSEDIIRTANQIIKNGHVKLSGIGVQRIDAVTAKQLGVDRGVLIGKIIKRSPASKAGLIGSYRDNNGYIHLVDVIVSVNSFPVNNYDDLYHIMSKTKVGSSIVLTVMRNAKKFKVKLNTIDITSY